jgi:DNA-binding transcriptional ArsR family regulator
MEMLDKPLAPQMALVLSTVRQFPGATLHELSLAALVPRPILSRRLADLEHQGLVAKDTLRGYHAIPITPADFEPLRSEIYMQWEHVNAMTFESATHRVRKLGDCWFAERKAEPPLHAVKLGTTFHSREIAQSACDADAYRQLSGR